MRSTLATMWLIQIMPVFCASGTFRRTRTHSRSKKNDVLLRNAREHFLANSRNNKFYEIRTEGMFHDIPSTIDRCWRKAAASGNVRSWEDFVAKVESCNDLNFWRELEARRDCRFV